MNQDNESGRDDRPENDRREGGRSTDKPRFERATDRPAGDTDRKRDDKYSDKPRSERPNAARRDEGGRPNDRRNDGPRSNDRPAFERRDNAPGGPGDRRDDRRGDASPRPERRDEGGRSNDRPRFERRDDGGRSNDRRSDARPPFGGNRNEDRRGDTNRDDARPRFNRGDDRPSDRRPFDRSGDAPRGNNRRDDRASGPGRRDEYPRPAARPSFNRDDKGGSDDRRKDAPRFERPNAAQRDDRRSDARPPFERRDNDRRSDDRSGNARPPFGGDRNRDDKSNARRSDARPPFGGDRNRDDSRNSDRPRRDDRPERPRFGDSSPRDNDRRGDARPSFNRPGGSDRRESGPRANDRRSNDRPPFERRDSREGGAERPTEGYNSRFSDEQRQDSRDRQTGKFSRAPNYDFERMRERIPPKKRKADEKRPHTYADDGLLRLNRYIANAGVCSRREADDLIARGDVSVNGKVITEMGYKVKADDVVRYGSRVLNPEKLVYVLLNKPKDFITTTDDPQERQTVMELVADVGPYRLYPVGRLDRNTTGLLLLTNDGELADKLTHPSNNVKKIYQVEIDKPIAEADFEKLREGVELEDGFIKPDEVGIVTPDAQVVGIEIHSGRNRIVRRLFEALGYEVTKLDRTVYGGLTKKELPRGKWRFLEPKEVVKLKYLQ